ncbi:MAG: hypothetical protein ACPGYT_07225 [Nitrospirales bacterium]
MNSQQASTNWTASLFLRKVSALTAASVLACLLAVTHGFASEPTNPLLREFTIQIDPSALHPPTKWQVPGITPLISIMDPVSTVAYSTEDPKALKLKPGKYQFGTYTFSFFFNVTLAGTLQYDKSLDQCVQGREKQKLIITCSHTQPYPQDPDYLN